MCCVCATTPPSASNEWVYKGSTNECTLNQTCFTQTQDILSELCYATMLYQEPPDGLSVHLSKIECGFGDIEGQSCSTECRALSKDWLGGIDYTFWKNEYIAENTCSLSSQYQNTSGNYSHSAGLCQFQALWYNKAARIFPSGICRYPGVRGLLVQFGAALGLVSGIIVTLRSLTRTA